MKTAICGKFSLQSSDFSEPQCVPLFSFRILWICVNNILVYLWLSKHVDCSADNCENVRMRAAGYCVYSWYAGNRYCGIFVLGWTTCLRIHLVDSSISHSFLYLFITTVLWRIQSDAQAPLIIVYSVPSIYMVLFTAQECRFSKVP